MRNLRLKISNKAYLCHNESYNLPFWITNLEGEQIKAFTKVTDAIDWYILNRKAYENITRN